MDTIVNAAVSSKMNSFKSDVLGSSKDPEKDARDKKKKQSELAKEKSARVCFMVIAVG